MPDQPIDEPAERQLGEAGLASERRAFEEWARNPARYCASLPLERYTEINNSLAGEYMHNETHLAWNAWLASASRKREEVRGG